MSEEDNCVICDGTGKNLFKESCVYCNGTGEPNPLAEEYMRNHICQCLIFDRKNCPICHKVCHHNSSQTPKQTIDSGWGGATATISIQPKNTFTVTTSDGPQEEFILA